MLSDVPPEIPLEPSGCTTGTLMEEVRRGDMGAYQELIRRYQKKVFRVICSYVHNHEDAMEVLQDTFLKVYMARQSWEERYSFAGWLYRIAINASIDRYRRSEKGKTTPIEAAMENQLQAPGTHLQTQDPLDRLQDLERRRNLENVVRRLPRRQREVVSLRYFGEMRLEEIAEVLGCPLGTVKSNLHKAILGLREMLRERSGGLIYE